MKRNGRWILVAVLLKGLGSACGQGAEGALPEEDGAAAAVQPVSLREAPPTLHATGLYRDGSSLEIAADVISFAPQYPLWTDGARKRRWIWLPPGTTVDAADPDAFRFPVGTKLWKEFAFERRVETRYMERAADGWLFATYLWNDRETTAERAPDEGKAVHAAGGPPAGYVVPRASDCRICHDGSPPVLGFSALQLSSDRDPLALHADAAPDANDLAELVARGIVRGLPEELRRTPPRIAADFPIERAALGYLHANCGGCHRSDGALGSVGLTLAHSLDSEIKEPAAVATTFGRRSAFVPPRSHAPVARITPGDPDQSVLLMRMRSRDPIVQMPPLGTRVVDEEAVQLLEQWIRDGARQGSARNADLHPEHDKE